MPASIEHDEKGRAIACKWASGEPTIARLRHEADMLTAARHPGVVELLDVRFDDSSASLRLAAAAGPALDQCPLLQLDEVAGLVAAVSTTVADLHRAGIMHGAIEPAHVVLDGDGRPLLCGFADAKRITDDPEAQPAGDVAGLGILLRALIPDPSEPASRNDPRVEVLRTLAGWAAAGDPSARPSAGELAAAIQQRVPTARLPRPTDLNARRNRHAIPPSLAGLLSPTQMEEAAAEAGAGRAASARFVIGAVALVALGTAIAMLGFDRPLRNEDGPALASDASSSDTTDAAVDSATSTTLPVATRVWPADRTTSTIGRTCPSVTAPLRADVDGDGCAEGLHYADGIITTGSRRWAVGRPGDKVAIANWFCRPGRRGTLAVLRQSDSSIWVFSEWPDAIGALAAAQQWGAVPGAEALRAVDADGDGCAQLVAERRGGPPVPLRPPGSSS